jgi:hypothetical protein
VEGTITGQDFRRRQVMPNMAVPASINTQLDGSGTAAIPIE